MKKTLISAAVAVLVSTGSALFAQEYGEFDYVGTDASQIATIAPQTAPVAENRNVDAQDVDVSDSQVKCFWGYRWYRSYYYRPTYYYVRTCRTYSYSYRYRYSYRFYRFYKSANVKSATNDFGAVIDENPQKGTPLATLGVVKGDVITHIDGKKIVDPKQLDEITAQSNLVVIKAEGGTNLPYVVAPVAPEIEYGAYEY